MVGACTGPYDSWEGSRLRPQTWALRLVGSKVGGPRSRPRVRWGVGSEVRCPSGAASGGWGRESSAGPRVTGRGGVGRGRGQGGQWSSPGSVLGSLQAPAPLGGGP